MDKVSVEIDSKVNENLPKQMLFRNLKIKVKIH